MEAAEDRQESLRMIRDSAAAVAPRRRRSQAHPRAALPDPGFDRATWREMGDMGWLGLRVRRSAGGSGLGARRILRAAEEFGAGLVPEPLIQGAMAARLLLGRAPRAPLLRGVAS